MKSGRPKQNPGDICDTVAHISPAAGASSLSDPRAVKSGQALRAALLTLLERKMLEQITIREIAAEAGVHYATFFRHYPTKEALLDDVAADQIDRLVELALPVFDAVNAPAAFLTLASYVDAHRKLWTTLLTGGAAGAMRAELLRVSQVVAVGRAPQEGWMPVELAVICTVSLIVEIVSWWLRQSPEALSTAQVAELLHRLVLSPSVTGIPV